MKSTEPRPPYTNAIAELDEIVRRCQSGASFEQLLLGAKKESDVLLRLVGGDEDAVAEAEKRGLWDLLFAFFDTCRFHTNIPPHELRATKVQLLWLRTEVIALSEQEAMAGRITAMSEDEELLGDGEKSPELTALESQYIRSIELTADAFRQYGEPELGDLYQRAASRSVDDVKAFTAALLDIINPGGCKETATWAAALLH